MTSISLISALLWALFFAPSLGSVPTIQTNVRALNRPSLSFIDANRALKRESAPVRLQARQNGSDIRSETVVLDNSWNDAVLLPLDLGNGIELGPDGVMVRCKKCYIMGNATASLAFADGDDVDEIFESIYNRSEVALESLWNRTKQEYQREDDGIGNSTVDVEIPALNFDPPAASIEFSFENLELFLDLQTTISEGASITIPFPRMIGPFPTSVELQSGIVNLDASFGFDLILAVKSGQVSIDSGVHLKVDDTLRFSIQLFGNKTSDINFNGGQFEFLDVIASTPGVSLSTILRVGAHVDAQVEKKWADVACDMVEGGCGIGIESSIYADIAEFVTNVTTSNEDDCELAVVQEYSIALGANAGATAHFSTFTVGPSVEHKTVIWATTMDSSCAISSERTTSTASITAPAYVGRREATATSVVTMQPNTSKSNSVFEATSFGSSATPFPTISGPPTSYTPSSTLEAQSAFEQRTRKQDWRLIVGLSVGLGVPFLAAVVVGVLLLMRRQTKKKRAASK